MQYYLLVLAFLCGGAATSLSAQLQGKVELLADNQTYLVSVLPDFTLYPGGSTTNNAQITVKVPTGGFVFDGITSITGNWTLENDVYAPVEDPGFDYFSFNANAIVGIVYEAGVENQLFTFRNSGTCTGTLDIIDNATDPFMPPNSANVNVGNLMTVLGLGPGNKYVGNYAAGAECPELLTLTTTTANALLDCHGDSTSIEVTIQGGVAPYQLTWVESTTNVTGATTVTAQNGSVTPGGFFAGEWTFEVADSDSNSASTTREIVAPAPLSISNITVSDASCDLSADGAITVSATGGTGDYTYQWSDGQQAPSATALAPADYALTVTDEKGCVLTIDGLTVSATNALSLDQIHLTDAACDAASNGTAAVTTTDGTAPFTYQWGHGSTDSLATGLAPGSYEVTVTDANGCSLVADQLVIGAGTGLQISSVNVTDASCGTAANGTIAPEIDNGTGPFAYAWSHGSTDSVATDLPAGDYSVTVTDANGCSATWPLITIEASGGLEVALIGTDAPNCMGSADGQLQVQASAGGRPYTYAWSNGATDSLATGLDPGVYRVTVTDAHGCTASLDSLALEADGFLQTVAVGRAPFCFGDTDASIRVTTEGNAGPFTYQWAHSATATGPVLDNITSGSYFYTVTDATGVCSVSDSVTIASPQRMQINTATTAPTCYGDEDGSLRVTEVLHASAPFLYSLDGVNFVTEAVFDELPGGVYTVHVEDANGCRDERGVLLNEPAELQIELGDDLNVPLGEEVTLYPATGGRPTFYEWVSSDSLDCYDCPHPTWVPLEASLVSVTVRDTFGCVASDALRIYVTRPESVFVPSAFSPNSDGQNDALTIFYGDDVTDVRDLAIFDRWGDRVFARSGSIPSADPSGNWSGYVRDRPAPSGVYVYRVVVTYLDGKEEVLQGEVTLLR